MEKSRRSENFKGKEKETETVISNILAARGVSDFIRTSLGPKGMDKMIISENNDVIISNDGATILDNLDVLHPVARMLVELSKSQDNEAGDGTTSIVVLAGALLEQAKKLIERGLHPNTVSDNFQKCADRFPEIVKKISIPVSVDNDSILADAATTSLSSKIVSSESSLLAPIAVKAVKAVIDPAIPGDVDLKNIRIVQKVGGTIEDSVLVDGLVFDQHASRSAGGPTSVKSAKIGLIQFQLSAPKTDMDFNLAVRKNEDIDRLNKEERRYVAKMVQKIAKSGCNVLLIQKSILRNAVGTLALHFLAKKKIMVITDVERSDVEFVSNSLGCKPVASIDDFTSEKLGSADLVEEENSSGGRLVFVRGVKVKSSQTKAVSILLRASNKLALAEAERSLHDALCVVRSLVRSPQILPGGGAAEMEGSVRLREWSQTLCGAAGLCAEAFAEALETIPFTLAENCGLEPVRVVSALRDRHQKGEGTAGIDVRRGCISDLAKQRVVQPSLVTLSCLSLATECVQMILKIDEVVYTARDL